MSSSSGLACSHSFSHVQLLAQADRQIHVRGPGPRIPRRGRRGGPDRARPPRAQRRADVLEPFPTLLTPLTGVSRPLARRGPRRGLYDRKWAVTTSSGRETPAFGGPSPSIGVAPPLARCPTSRRAPQLSRVNGFGPSNGSIRSERALGRYPVAGRDGSAYTGSQRRARRPPPGASSRATSPPWLRATSRAMVRPRPTPPVSGLREPSSR